MKFVQAPGGDPLTAQSLGVILSVRGAEARVAIPVAQTGAHARATVGDFVRIFAGQRRLIGMITEVQAQDGGGVALPESAIARIDVMGEIVRDALGCERFQRGVSAYPAIGDAAGIVARDDLRLIYAGDVDGADIGRLHHDDSIPARISIHDMLNKHFAVLGSTGVGKSSGAAVILNAVMDKAPNVRILMLDGHNEFGRCFGARANVVNSQSLKLPFWLFNFEELIDVVYAGRPAVDEELEILSEHIPVAKGMYLAQRAQSDRYGLRKIDPKRSGFTVDTPVPYQLQDLIGLIDERMGKLENRATRMHCHRLLARLDSLKNDPRYAFMFENANVGGDTMAEIVTNLFRLEPNGQPITVLQLAGLPAEVVDAVVCVVARMAFDFGLWSDGAAPLLFVCEEAHRYAPADRSVGFAPTRRALMRIAKEGRKYGVYLGLITQRPGELDPTIISQCNTLFAMRLANERDQALLRSAVTDAVANLLAFVPSLGTREVVAFGEGLPLPTRFRFTELPAERQPHSETFRLDAGDGVAERGFVRQVIERWRGATVGSRATAEPPQPAVAPASAPPPLHNGADPNSSAARLEQLRAQILKRAPGLT
jgi:DNA helicase HerA-like ATPase